MQRRLARQALVLGSLWFPTRAELLEWGRSGCPVYVRPLGAGRIAVGPRLGAMWASVFSPCFIGEVRPAGSGSEVIWARALPRLTKSVLAIWVVLVCAWGVAIALGLHPGGALWWAIITAGTLGAPAVGALRGGRALDETVPWLTEVLLAPDEEEDW